MNALVSESSAALDLAKTTRRDRAASAAAFPDRLPPHSERAEQGVLGCCLLSPVECLAIAIAKFGTDEVFYDLRHQAVWSALTYLHSKSRPIDVITVQQELHDRQRLEQVGGIPYLNQLQDAVPSAANLGSYLEIVWEKFLWRRLLQFNTEQVAKIYDFGGGLTEGFVDEVDRDHESWKKLFERGAVTPKLLRQPAHFQDEFYAEFIGERINEPGIELPIQFPLKIRRQENTLLSGDDGSGKSTLLKYFVLHLARAGEKICMASLEEPPCVCLWVLAAQLLGVKRVADTDAGRRAAAAALAWLNERFIIYDFLGIGEWRDILGAFRYAAEHLQCRVFVIDNVMRVGIPDDDYAQQGFAASAFAQFAMESDAHLFYVLHENKADARGKARIRGTKLWTANAGNVLRVERNTDKGEKMDEVKFKIAQGKARKNQNESVLKEIKDLEENLESLRKAWDTRLVLQKQRRPGTQQNASKRFWFDYQSFQFREHPGDPAVDWLKRWKPQRNGEGAP